MAEIRLKSSEFRRDREATWRQLERLVDKIERGGLKSLSATELTALPMLYRATVSSLSVARTIALDWNLLSYLETLSLRAYTCVYGTRQGLGAVVRSFLARDLPRAVRAARWHVLIAAALLALGVLIGWLLVAQDMAYFHLFVPLDLAGSRGPMSSREDLAAVLFDNSDTAAVHLLTFSSSLFIHNLEVGILGFALGIALALPTVGLTAYQGLILGAMCGLYADRGLTTEFIAWLLVHGVTELLAITLCFAGGLKLGETVLFPGRLTRRDALARNGPEAAKLVICGIAMLAVAALLEGIVRQVVTDTGVRLAIGATTAAGWAAYFLLAGRAPRS